MHHGDRSAVAASDATENGELSSVSIGPATESSLTRRAGLTFLSNIFQQSARLTVSLVATPVIVRGLGAELYGAWAMIQQMTAYLSLGDARPMGALKFTLTTEQHIDDPDLKRRQVGAALVLWLAGLPLLLTVGYGLVRLAPSLIRVVPESVETVQWALGLSVVALAMDRLFGLPGNILRGVNLDYKAMWLNTSVIIFAGAATCWVILRGYGLVGLAVVSMLPLLLACVPRLWIVHRDVSWFGVQRPRRADLTRFTRLGGWLFLVALGSVLMMASDLLVVGYLLGPAAAASYAMTGAAVRLCLEPIVLLVSAGNAGIAGLCGTGQFGRVEQARREMLVTGLVLFVIAGAGILVLNKAFVSLWVGPTLYAGNLTNALLVVAAFQLLLFRTDSIILDSLLAFKEKVAVMVVAGLSGMVIGGLLVRAWGLPGMAAGTIVGRMVLVGAIPFIIKRLTGISALGTLRVLARPLAVGAVLLAAAGFMVPGPSAAWIALAVWSGPTVLITAAAMLASLHPGVRKALFARGRGALQSGNHGR